MRIFHICKRGRMIKRLKTTELVLSDGRPLSNTMKLTILNVAVLFLRHAKFFEGGILNPI